MPLAYELRHGSYYLMDLDEVPSRLTGERSIRTMTDEVALAFDLENGTLHKHGQPAMVESWANQVRQAYRAQGADELANAIVVLTGAFPVEELNRCLSTTGYCLEFFSKLQQGLVSSAKVPAEALADASIPAPTASGGDGSGVTPVPTGTPARRSPFPHRR